MKKKKIYICENCGYESPKWFGKCPICGEWNTAIELDSQDLEGSSEFIQPKTILELGKAGLMRFSSGISELDRVLGGGIVPASVILIGGDPGVGKSTLMMQMCASMKDKTTLFVSGEESEEQIKIRAKRMELKEIPKFNVIISNDLLRILKTVERLSPEVVVIDSIQSMRIGESIPGSIIQLRRCTEKIVEFAKTGGVAFFLIGHITKSKELAGPKLLEHVVDVVLYFEGEMKTDRRILRSIKNRYGPTNEIAIFEMTDKGLKEIEDPSFVLIEQGDMLPGSCVASVIEGIRPILVEVQALVSKTTFGMPRRLTKGLDLNRVIMITAVMNRKLGIPLEKYDVYVNVRGGLSIKDPGIDLAVAAAIYSSFIDVKIRKKTVFFGEIGLDGKVRKVHGGLRRIDEARRLGFQRIISPETVNIEDLSDALKMSVE